MTISILALKGKLKRKNLTVAFLFLSGIDRWPCAGPKIRVWFMHSGGVGGGTLYVLCKV